MIILSSSPFNWLVRVPEHMLVSASVPVWGVFQLIAVFVTTILQCTCARANATVSDDVVEAGRYARRVFNTRWVSVFRGLPDRPLTSLKETYEIEEKRRNLGDTHRIN